MIKAPKNNASKLTSKVSNSTSAFRIFRTAWQDRLVELSAVRRAVFIEEQNVPESLEWDGLDETAMHVLAVNAAGSPIGCGRLLPEGKIGRMAVLPAWRSQRVGRTMLETLVDTAREQGMARIELSAQVAAIPFYEKSGFRVCSGIYLDAGIPHRDMVKNLFPQ